jgi:hypothetical protein
MGREYLSSNRIGLIIRVTPAEIIGRNEKSCSEARGPNSMVCKAILKTGLALCLVFQASAPCCCAFQHAPSLEGGGVRQHRCHKCPMSAPAGCPSSHCWICSVLGQVVDLPCSSPELSDNRTPVARPFELDPAVEARTLATLAACRCDAIPLCDIYEMQTLRE